MTHAVGFAVAGGKSRRMGGDKALLAWGGTTLLDHTLTRLRAACREVRILCGPEPRYADRDVPVHPDAPEAAGAGSLGGVYTGLLQLGEAPGLFLGIDIPLVTAALLRHLLERAEGHDAVVPVSEGGPEPLCAVYRRTCLEPIRRRMQAGEFKMTAFWPDVRVCEVGAAELSRFGRPGEMFLNINTRADYVEALGLSGSTGR